MQTDEPFPVDIEIDSPCNFITADLLEKIAAVHPDALVMWDRDVVLVIRKSTYLSFHPAFFASESDKEYHNATVYIGSINDRESWFEWECGQWMLHQATQTKAEIIEAEEREHDEFMYGIGLLDGRGWCSCRSCTIRDFAFDPSV